MNNIRIHFVPLFPSYDNQNHGIWEFLTIRRQSWLATTIQKPLNCNPSKSHLHLKIHQMRNVLQSPSGTQMNWDTEVIGELSERMYIQNYSSYCMI